MGDRVEEAAGSVVAATLEGSRALLVEVQALVTTGGPMPRRTASGLDPNRLALLIAVLGRRAGIGLASHDVYANLAGGLRVDDPALDLPLAIALASSLRDRPVRPGTVAFGEVGLLGELRAVAGLDRRLREAARLGFTRAVVPRSSRPRGEPAPEGIEIVRGRDPARRPERGSCRRDALGQRGAAGAGFRDVGWGRRPVAPAPIHQPGVTAAP